MLRWKSEKVAGVLGCISRLKLLPAICGLLCSCVPRTAPAEIIDRVAVSLANEVITESEIRQDIRLTSFLNQEKPDYSAQARRQTANRLIDQRLVRREIELSRYPEPTEAEIAPLLQQIRERYPSQAAYQAALTDYGISAEELRNRLRWQLTFLRFVDVRFRSGIQVTDEEIQEYFDKSVKPTATAANHGQPVSIDDFRDKIEDTLTAQRTDQALDRWLQRARTRNPVEWHEEAFK